jgi:hypothetical protein
LPNMLHKYYRSIQKKHSIETQYLKMKFTIAFALLATPVAAAFGSFGMKKAAAPKVVAKPVSVQGVSLVTSTCYSFTDNFV